MTTDLARVACPRCGTELDPTALSCPVCHALVHGALLTQLASDAEAATAQGRLADARDAWTRALGLLPRGTQQHAAVQVRIDELTSRLSTEPGGATAKPRDERPWYRRWIAAIVTGAVFVAGKIKLLLLGLTKASTLLSMFAYFGVYWSLYGWPFAAGLVVSIYIHEMGHVAELRRLGIAANAPLFIPGVGAVVMLQQHIEDASVDARIGLAGPVWGLGAALVAFAIALATGNPVWKAIAHWGAYINLFNLIPVWQLDGSRGFHALARAQRWAAVAALAAIWALSREPLLLVIALVAAYRATQRTATEGDTRALVTYVGLAGALAGIAMASAHGMAR